MVFNYNIDLKKLLSDFIFYLITNKPYSNNDKWFELFKYTIYNFDNEIYKQYNLYEIQDQFSGEPLFEVREETDEIDDSKDFDTITNIPNA